MKHLAERVSRLGTETAFEVLAKAKSLERQGKSIIHLQIGEPDFDTAPNVRAAAQKALDDGYTHYVEPSGIFAARQAVAESAQQRYKYSVPVDPAQVIIMPGAKPVIYHTIMALINPGDEVMYPNPGFPIFESVIRYAGGVPIPYPLLESNDFGLDTDHFKAAISERTKLIILNSPSNPCGSILSDAQLELIAEYAIANDLMVLTDEVYKDIYYDGREHSSISTLDGMRERTVVLDGASKSYAMTGWRLGFGIYPDWLVKPITRSIINDFSCTSAFSQMGLIEALSGPQDSVTNMVAEFTERRDLVVNGLNQLPGISCRKPDGTFYAFPNIKETGISSAEFADRALNEAGVALLAGTSFGKYGEGYLRVSFANSQENIKEALRRLSGLL